MWTRQIKLLKLTETTAKKSNDVIVWDKTKTIILNDKIAPPLHSSYLYIATHEKLRRN